MEGLSELCDSANYLLQTSDPVESLTKLEEHDGNFSSYPLVRSLRGHINEYLDGTGTSQENGVNFSGRQKLEDMLVQEVAAGIQAHSLDRRTGVSSGKRKPLQRPARFDEDGNSENVHGCGSSDSNSVPDIDDCLSLSSLPPYETLGSIASKLLSDAGEDRQRAFDELSAFSHGDILASDKWVELRNGLRAAMGDSNEEIAEQALTYQLGLWRASAEASVQTVDVYLNMLEHVTGLFKGIAGPASLNPDLRSIFLKVRLLRDMMSLLPSHWLYFPDALSKEMYTKTFNALVDPVTTTTEKISFMHAIAATDPLASWFSAWVTQAGSRNDIVPTMDRTELLHKLVGLCLHSAQANSRFDRTVTVDGSPVRLDYLYTLHGLSMLRQLLKSATARWFFPLQLPKSICGVPVAGFQAQAVGLRSVIGAYGKHLTKISKSRHDMPFLRLLHVCKEVIRDIAGNERVDIEEATLRRGAVAGVLKVVDSIVETKEGGGGGSGMLSMLEQRCLIAAADVFTEYAQSNGGIEGISADGASLMKTVVIFATRSLQKRLSVEVPLKVTERFLSAACSVLRSPKGVDLPIAREFVATLANLLRRQQNQGSGMGIRIMMLDCLINCLRTFRLVFLLEKHHVLDMCVCHLYERRFAREDAKRKSKSASDYELDHTLSVIFLSRIGVASSVQSGIVDAVVSDFASRAEEPGFLDLLQAEESHSHVHQRLFSRLLHLAVPYHKVGFLRMAPETDDNERQGHHEVCGEIVSTVIWNLLRVPMPRPAPLWGQIHSLPHREVQHAALRIVQAGVSTLDAAVCLDASACLLDELMANQRRDSLQGMERMSVQIQENKETNAAIGIMVDSDPQHSFQGETVDLKDVSLDQVTVLRESVYQLSREVGGDREGIFRVDKIAPFACGYDAQKMKMNHKANIDCGTPSAVPAPDLAHADSTVLEWIQGSRLGSILPETICAVLVSLVRREDGGIAALGRDERPIEFEWCSEALVGKGTELAARYAERLTSSGKAALSAVTADQLGVMMAAAQKELVGDIDGLGYSGCDWLLLLFSMLFSGEDEAKFIEFVNDFATCAASSYLWPRRSIRPLREGGTRTLSHGSDVVLLAVEQLLHAEAFGVVSCFKMEGLSVLHLVQAMINQVCLNFLNFDDILAYIMLPLTKGIDWQVYFLVAVVKHIGPTVSDAMVSGDVISMAQPYIQGFSASQYLDYCRMLEVKYRDQIMEILRSQGS